MIHPYNYKEPTPICPQCGHELKDKKVQAGKKWKRSLVYEVCKNCDYKHLKPSEKERAIEDGIFDNE